MSEEDDNVGQCCWTAAVDGPTGRLLGKRLDGLEGTPRPAENFGDFPNFRIRKKGERREKEKR